MKIYLIYEEHYDQDLNYYDSVTVYPYKSMYSVIQRLIDETGKNKRRNRTRFKGNKFHSNSTFLLQNRRK